MQLVPTPWLLIPDGDDVLGPDGRAIPARLLRPRDPGQLSTLALRCVYSEAEIMTRAIIVLVENLGRVEPV
jgi:hypothetical protein